MLPEELKKLKTQDLQGKLQFVRDRLKQAQQEAAVKIDGKDSYDHTRVKAYGVEFDSGVAFSEKVRADTELMNDLHDEITARKSVEDTFGKMSEPVEGIKHPTSKDPSAEQQRPVFKTVGEKITDALKAAKERTGAETFRQAIKMSGELRIPDVSMKEFLVGYKTLFETSAGWAPESVRSGVVVPAVTRPIQLLDIMPMGQIGQAAAVYMEETTRTHGATEKAEGAAYAESTFVLTQQSQTVEKITDSVPVTDEQLEDVAQAQSYLEERLRFGIRQRLDNQILNGTGVTPLLQGILNDGSIQTQAKASDPVPDAFYKAMTAILLTGRAMATHHVMHPNDWQAVRLLRTTDGVYIWGNPSEAGPERLWGLPVVKADVIAENTGLCGSFEGAWIQLLERRGIILEVGYDSDDFTTGQQHIRASMRAVNVIYRAPAFCEVTGI